MNPRCTAGWKIFIISGVIASVWTGSLWGAPLRNDAALARHRARCGLVLLHNKTVLNFSPTEKGESFVAPKGIKTINLIATDFPRILERQGARRFYFGCVVGENQLAGAKTLSSVILRNGSSPTEINITVTGKPFLIK